MIYKIVVETSRYAEQTLANFDPADPVSNKELKWFFAMVFAMGPVNKLNLQKYLSSYEVLKTVVSFDCLVTSLRWQQLSHTQRSVRVWIHSIFGFLQLQFGEVYQPCKELRLDESVIGWHDNVHFKLYNATKANKFHLKVYMLSEGTPRYIMEYEIYDRKNNNISRKGATCDVVMRLFENYLDEGYYYYRRAQSFLIICFYGRRQQQELFRKI